MGNDPVAFCCTPRGKEFIFVSLKPLLCVLVVNTSTIICTAREHILKEAKGKKQTRESLYEKIKNDRMTIPNRTVCVYFAFASPLLARIGCVTASVWVENCGKIQSAIRARSCGLGAGFFLSSFSTLALNAGKENSKRTGVGESGPREKREVGATRNTRKSSGPFIAPGPSGILFRSII